VKTIKYMMLGAIVVAALAFAPAAMAAPGYFTAESYPATVTGVATGAQGVLTTSYGTSKCNSPELSSSLTHPSETLSSQMWYSKCTISASAKCSLVLHPPTEGTVGSIDITGTECVGIEASQTTEIRVPPQTGLKASFENQGSGSGATVKVSLEATSLKYEAKTISGWTTYTNGSYTTSWVLSGKSGGVATGMAVLPYPGLSIADLGSGPEFHSPIYPVTIAGELTSDLEASTVVGKVKCKAGSFTTSGWAPEGLIADTSELVMTPSFSKCTLAGLSATVTPKGGCWDTFSVTGSAPYTGSLFICQTEVAVAGSPCVVTLTNQTRSGMGYANVGSGSTSSVQATANLSGVSYQVANGATCPNEAASGSYSTGTLKGGVSLKISKVH
jgi:hypothetical protein